MPRRDTVRSEAIERAPVAESDERHDPGEEVPIADNAVAGVSADARETVEVDEGDARTGANEHSRKTTANEPATLSRRGPQDTADDCFVAPPSLTSGQALTEAFDRLLDWAMVASGATGSFVADDAGFALARRHVDEETISIAGALRRVSISAHPTSQERGFGTLRLGNGDHLGILWWSGTLGLLYIGLRLPDVSALKLLERMLVALDGST